MAASASVVMRRVVRWPDISQNATREVFGFIRASFVITMPTCAVLRAKVQKVIEGEDATVNTLNQISLTCGLWLPSSP
eukprot:6212414-Pleurochrysis_carterae.AAC.5